MEGDEGSFDLSQEEAPTQMWEPEEEPEGGTAMEVPPSRAEEEEEDGGSQEGGGRGEQQEEEEGGHGSGEPEGGEERGGDDMVMAEEEDDEEEGEQARQEEEGDESLESEQMMAEEEEEEEEEPETMDPLLALLDGQQKQRQEQQRLKQQQEAAAVAAASKKKAGRAPPSKSAWMFYLQQNKDQVKKDQPGLKITQVFKLLAERWKDLSEDDKQVYHDMAQQDKERALLQQQQQQEASVIGEPGSAAMEVEGGRGLSTDLHLPLAAIRRIMKLDPEVKTVSKDAALLVAKATELFLETLGEETLRVAQASRRKALKPEDVASGMRRKDRLAFLRPDFPLDTTTTAAKKTGNTNKKPAALPVATGQKGIEAFYSKKRQASSAEDGEEQDDEPN